MNDNIKYSLNVNKGIWHVSFRLDQVDKTKKQKCLSTSVSAGKDGKSNKRAAEKAAAEIVAKYTGLISSDEPEMLLGDYMRIWVGDKVTIQPSTKDGYLHMINKHIAPYFEEHKIKLKEVMPIHIQRFMNSKLISGLSNNTVNKQYTLIRTSLKDAVANQYIKRNAADKVDKLPREHTHYNFYKAEQLKTLIKVVKDTDLELPVMFAVLFGLRRSEVLGVKWSAINFEEKTFTVSEKITRQRYIENDLYHVHDIASNKLKTEASYDTYLLNDAVCIYLLRKKDEQKNMKRANDKYIDFVCVNKVGDLLKLDYVTAKFNGILKANNLPHIRFHDLRHSCITLLSNDGSFSMKQVQGYARHANYSTTADTYSHVVEDVKLTELTAISSSIGIDET